MLTQSISDWGCSEIFNFLDGRRDEEKAQLAEGIRKAFVKIKDELDEHLETINQTSSDVQEFGGFLSELEAKIDKLTERLDEMEMNNPAKAIKPDIKLTLREQEVFMVLYLGKIFTSTEIAKRLGFTEDMVNLYLINLITKGVPVVKELMDDLLVFSLEPEFKDLQARRNVLEIDSRIAKQISAQTF